MPTVNTAVTHEWTKVAETGDANVFLSVNGSTAIELATTTANTAPTGIRGHIVSPRQSVTRSQIGGGYIWARAPSYVVGSPNPVTVIVTK